MSYHVIRHNVILKTAIEITVKVNNDPPEKSLLNKIIEGTT